MNSKRAIKVDFPKHVKSEFVKIANAISRYLKSACPDQILSSFAVDEYYDGTTSARKISYTANNGQIEYEEVKDLFWSDLVVAIPGLNEFCEKYNLEHSFILAEVIDVPPHRHFYSPNSMWSITMFLDSVSGTLKFFENGKPVGASESVDRMGKETNNWICSEQIKSSPGDFYSINTWIWHGWTADEVKNYSTVGVFYMKNAVTQKQALDSLTTIKNNN